MNSIWISEKCKSVSCMMICSRTTHLTALKRCTCRRLASSCINGPGRNFDLGPLPEREPRNGDLHLMKGGRFGSRPDTPVRDIFVAQVRIPRLRMKFTSTQAKQRLRYPSSESESGKCNQVKTSVKNVGFVPPHTNVTWSVKERRRQSRFS